jgi:primosomal protein N'
MYTDVCLNCGKFFHCPECQAPLPAMATRCMVCSTDFNCRRCGEPYPRAYSWRCPHCGFWNE